MYVFFALARQDDIVVGNELRQAAFRAYASLSANDEDIRKKVSSYSFVLMRFVISDLRGQFCIISKSILLIFCTNENVVSFDLSVLNPVCSCVLCALVCFLCASLHDVCNTRVHSCR